MQDLSDSDSVTVGSSKSSRFRSTNRSFSKGKTGSFNLKRQASKQITSKSPVKNLATKTQVIIEDAEEDSHSPPPSKA